jgi:uncharacterized protein
MRFDDLFVRSKPWIGTIHLMPLPGAPLYDGNLRPIYDRALEEAEQLQKHGCDGLILENFRDRPFYPDRLPAETIATLASLTREVLKTSAIPVGVNALRNDPEGAMAIASATGAHFMRVNVHVGAVVADQGILQGVAHRTVRLRSQLKSNVLIFADVEVKHSAPLASRGLAQETKEICERGLADAVIVTGQSTGSETELSDLEVVKVNAEVPVLIGSGITPQNLERFFPKADGFIVGSYYKIGGKAENFIDEARLDNLGRAFHAVEHYKIV